MEYGEWIARAYREVIEDVAINVVRSSCFCQGGQYLGRCSVRVGCCVSLLVVVKECITGIERVCRGVYNAVAIEYSS